MTNDYSPADFHRYHEALIGQLKLELHRMLEAAEKVDSTVGSSNFNFNRIYSATTELRRLANRAYLDLAHRERPFPEPYEDRLASRVAKFRRRQEREAKRAAQG